MSCEMGPNDPYICESGHHWFSHAGLPSIGPKKQISVKF